MINVHAMDDLQLRCGHTVKPTVFPDNTSQVWKLPDHVINSLEHRIVWWFESEAEFMHLASLRRLLFPKPVHLFMPFLPYGRQDKVVRNDSTFNLSVFAQLLNSMKFDSVSTLDAHNPDTGVKIERFTNLSPEPYQRRAIEEVKPHYIVYPDVGALQRYQLGGDRIVFYKMRDQQTGQITGHELSIKDSRLPHTLHTKDGWVFEDWTRFLIIDDICDGGATFISIAKKLRETKKQVDISLFVTHGIFSKGVHVLEEAGIRPITTNSLLKNTGGYEVYP